MQLLKNEEPINFERLEKKLAEVQFNSKEGKELLIKLMTEPQSKLSSEEVINYGELQGYLLNDDPELRRQTSIAICLAVLKERDKGHKVANRITDTLRQQKEEFILPSLRYISELDLIGWQAFCNILQASNIISLYIMYESLALLNEARWQAFCNSLKSSKIASLYLIHIYLEQLDPIRWQALCNALQESKITSFYLEKNNLAQVDLVRWQALCNALQVSVITSFNLAENNLGQLDQMRWQTLCNGLQASNITSLNLDRNNLKELDSTAWQGFCNALQLSKITTLYLTDNHLGELDSVRWVTFCNALQLSRITSITLAFNKLKQLHQVQWQAFYNALQASKITSLDLTGNNLDELDNGCWETFCYALKVSKVTTLNLTNNNLRQLDQVKWQTFCDAIDASTITSLHLGTDEPDRSQTQKLITLMNNNFHLVLQTTENLFLPSELKKLNERNRFLQQTSQEAQAVINSKPDKKGKDYITKIDKAVTDLDNCLLWLQDKDTSRSNEMRTQLENTQDNLKWKKGVWLRDQVLFKKNALKTQNFFNHAREVWLSISSKSKHFEEARHELFQLVYNNVSQDPKANAHEALIEALPYLVDEKNQLINLSIENQKVFDSFLFAAAGGQAGGLNREFTPEQRVVFLQYVLLLEVKQSLEKKDSVKTDTQFFKTEHTAALINPLKDLSLDPNNLDAEKEKKFNNLWAKIYDRLQEMPLSDNDTNTLIEAINHLAFPTLQARPK